MKEVIHKLISPNSLSTTSILIQKDSQVFPVCLYDVSRNWFMSKDFPEEYFGFGTHFKLYTLYTNNFIPLVMMPRKEFYIEEEMRIGNTEPIVFGQFRSSISRTFHNNHVYVGFNKKTMSMII